MDRRKAIDIAMSVLAAIILWAYVINVENPPTSTTIKNIPVEIFGMDELHSSGLTIAGDGEYTVDLSITASRAEVSAIKPGNFIATASVKGLGAGQNYIMVDVKGPDGVTINDIRSQKVQVYVDELVTEEKPLKIACGKPKADSEVMVLGSEYENVKVTGAKSFVAMVKEVRVDLDVSELEIDIPQTENLLAIALDASGNIVNNIDLEDDYIEVTAVIYETKTVALGVSYSGEPAYNANIESVSIPGRITIKGTAEDLKDISFISAEPLNIDGISKDTTLPVKVKLPEGIYLSDDCLNYQAVFTLSKTGSVSFSYDAEDLLREADHADGVSLSVDSDTEVTVVAEGLLEDLRGITKDQLKPQLSLGEMTEGENDAEIIVNYAGQGISVTTDPEKLIVIYTTEDSELSDETEKENING